MIPLTTIREKIRENGFHFDRKAARRGVGFFQNELIHIKGEWAGQHFKLERWQHKIIKRVLGWKREDGNRVAREVYIEVPRKCGKSYIGSGFALYLTFADNEAGAEVVSAAAETEQASIVFETAKEMVMANPKLSKLCKPYRRSLAVYRTASSYKVLSAQAYSKHGKNLHGVIIDELHAQPNRDLVDVLITSTGSRRQPLIIYLTTAGFDKNSICYEKHDYAEKIKKGIIEDFSFAPFVFAADQDDDWTDPKVWAKANPNLGVSKKVSYMERECEKAKNVPAYENTFKRLDLNIWTEQETRFIQMLKWDACKRLLDLSVLAGRTCYAGLDLSSTTDISALGLLFPLDENEYFFLPKFYVPQENIKLRAMRDRVPYDLWVRQGFIKATPGVSVDYDHIREDYAELAKTYDIKRIAIDRWNATQLAKQLGNDGAQVELFGQGFGSMSDPTKHLTKLVLEGNIMHNDNPVLRWMASNASVEQDAAGNIKFSKAKSTERIDGMISLVMSLGIADKDPQRESIYAKRGLLVL